MTPASEHSDARILVVDDEEQNLSLISSVLAAAGYEHVRTLDRSDRAVACFADERPDLVLLDLHMPPPDGFEVMHGVRELVDPDDFLPILVLSADGSPAAKQRALANGATDFVAKPLQLAEVLLRIKNLLDTRSVHRTLRDSHASMSAELQYRYQAEKAEAERLQAISERIRGVLDAGGPVIVYQPILLLPKGDLPSPAQLVIDLTGEGHGRSGSPASVGFEALARFNGQPRQGPDRWFDDANQVALGLDLELAAIDAALPAIDALPEGTFISLNASWMTIVSERLHTLLEAVDGEKVVVELTEHERVTDYGELAKAVGRLHDRGTRLAVDDTGAGFSSLEHILRLGPDIVKLDRNLISGVDHDPIRRSMIAALVHFATETGMDLIAEGIENPEELETLRRLGVRWAQGYHLAMPSDLDTALAHTPAPY